MEEKKKGRNRETNPAVAELHPHRPSYILGTDGRRHDMMMVQSEVMAMPGWDF